jgi:8-oxo-dGTP pyrophosphatase MutT (NUDIX family)
MSYIDKLAWIHIKERRVLGTRSKGKDTYYIPGGKRENQESDHQALTREISEELNVRLLPNSLKFLGQFEAQAHGKPEGVKVKMTCYTGEYEGEIQASCEIEELYWLKHRDRDKGSPVDVIILDWLKERNLID